MKATGIVRRIDDLGRVVIPKEIRRTLRIREGDPLEIYTDREGEVIFKKYSPIGELSEFAAAYADSLSKTSGRGVCITDTDTVIAVSGASKKEMSDKRISNELEKIMSEKNMVICSDKAVEVVGGNNKFSVGVVAPILAEGDTMGTVVMLDNSQPIGKVEESLVKTAAEFLGRQLVQ